jgi:molecular chaperone GrpE
MADDNILNNQEGVEGAEYSDDVEFVDTDAMGDELKDKAKLKKLKDELKESQKERMEYLTALQRARADYANLQKESAENGSRIKDRTTENIISDFLKIADSFDMAMSNKDVWNAIDSTWRVGVEYIYQQLQAIFSDYGVVSYAKEGDVFDPALHTSITTEKTDDESKDHMIARVIQKGYRLKDRVIRPAQVVVWQKGQ